MFGDGVYARQMRLGMQDIVDIKGLHDNSKLYEASTGDFAAPFDALMGIKTYHPDTKTFTEGSFTFDVVPDMRKRCFAIQDTKLEGYAYTARFGCFNYFKCEIAYSDGSYTRFYGFVTNQTYLNSANAVLFEYAIDWAHTAQLYRGGAATYYQPFDLKEAYVVRDNKHYIKEPRTGVKIIDCGRGKEDVVPFEMPLLIDETPYEYALANLSTFSDRDIRYIRFTFSQTNIAQELFSSGINAQRDELGTGLVYGFLPLIPRGEYSYVRQVFGAYQIGVNYDEYLDRTNALTRALTLAPTCVSVELIPSAPFAKSVSSLRTAQGNLGIEINFDTNVVVGITPTIEALKDKIVLIQTGIDDTHKVPKVSEYNAGLDTGYINSPPLTCAYKDTTFANDYKHTLLRTDKPLEPKLGQLQYASTQIKDNIGGAIDIDTLAPNGDIEKIQVVADYTGSTFKRKWYVSDNDRAYMNDINGRQYCAISDKMNGYPLVNNSYIDYMNGRRNQVINGLAVSQASGWAKFASAIISDTAQVAATGQAGSTLGKGAISGIQSVLASKWNFDAQTADLKEQTNGVERSTGNNPEFDVIANNGTITRYIWRTSEKDTRRLVEYFHRHGYAVGEIQQDISTDSMYYFDYIQCSDIVFGQDVNGELSNSGQFIMFRECDEYIRDMFAKGVRIWHGRCPDQDKLKPQIFVTPYINTAKEY